MSRKELIHTSGKRKSAIARATLHKGAGSVRINSVPLDIYEPRYARERIREPLLIAGPLASEVAIEVNVAGGGIMGQADASRLAIAKALAAFGGEKLRKTYLDYDRNLLVADSRRKETRKPGPSRARSAAQKSKR